MNPTGNQTKDGFWKRNLDKIGAGGSLFAALCCLGFPALLSILSAIGLGFLLHDAVLLPLLFVFVILTNLGLWMGVRRHGSRRAFFLGVVASVLLLASMWFSSVLVGVSLVLLITASGLNLWLKIRQQRCETQTAHK